MTPHGKVILQRLSPRQREILSLICTGITDNEIADKLGISAQVVKNHASKIRLKTQRKNRTDVAIFAFYHGIVACPCQAAEQNHK